MPNDSTKCRLGLRVHHLGTSRPIRHACFALVQSPKSTTYSLLHADLSPHLEQKDGTTPRIKSTITYKERLHDLLVSIRLLCLAEEIT